MFKNKLIDRCNMTCNFSFNEQFLVPIDKDEIKNKIKNLKDETASGFDKISVKILKKIEIILQSHYCSYSIYF